MRLGSNMSYKQIGDAMNIHRETVERRMVWAEKAGLFLDLEKQVIENIVPKAMKAIETALEDGDAETALEILKSVGVLRDPKAPRTQKQEFEDNALQEAIAGAREQRAIEDGTLEGTVVGRGGLAGLLEQNVEVDANKADEEGAPEGRSELEPTTGETAEEVKESDL
jgi:DNA-binding Lrp family transcriptional regulator